MRQSVATYTSNVLGERVRKVAGSSDVDFVYGRSGKLIGEYTNGAQIREYVYLDNVPVAQIAANGAITYLHPDHLGTPRSATNANAQIVWRWDSDPFGSATPNQDPDGVLVSGLAHVCNVEPTVHRGRCGDPPRRERRSSQR